ncbi:(deoxy)nucleoside triphosphate pyrophosphohydrolase [Clostridiaceae bacterium M8S5]|nr:(deoxy)nucleoside triphosphate pyrophosphohydrolase [Clostridiaceae bacterium M8S5]
MKKYEVVAGIIKYNDEILCMQRGSCRYDYMAYKYEFPGGKIEEGETKEEALSRELKEEIDINVTISNEQHFMTVEHVYPDFTIKMYSYICEVQSKDIVCKEHIDYKWLKCNQLGDLDWAVADIPIVKELESLKRI